jgi:L-threonylcarbamoyladenylate synthase
VFDGGAEPHLREAGEILLGGGVVAIPTETVYGLAANAADARAVERIFTIKGRPQDNPLITHIASPDDLFLLSNDVPDAAVELARRFWPGPLTFVLPSAGAVCDRVTAGLDTVAVRCPAHPVARAVIRYAAVPLAAPSANPSGRPSPTSAAHVMADYAGNTAGIDGIVDGGICSVGVESTVLDLSGGTPALLRYGGVGAEELRVFLPDLIIKVEPENDIARSPGQKHRHYAPSTPLRLLPDSLDEAVKLLLDEKNNYAVLCPDDEAVYFPGPSVVTYGASPDEMAARLFDAMRRADALGADTLYARLPPGSGVSDAVRDRLLRASLPPV